MSWLEQTFYEHSPLLFHVVLRSGLSQKDAEDLVQELYAKLKANHQPQPNNPRAFLTACLRRLVIDLVRKQAARNARIAGPDEVRNEPIDVNEPSPLENIRRHEQAARRRLLVCDLFASYVEYAELGERWEQREVLERSLRGQQPQEIAAAMKLKPARVHTHKSNASKWLAKHAKERDGNGSVLMSAFTTPPPSVELPPSPLSGASVGSNASLRPATNPDAPLPTAMSAIVAWSITDAGAICPSDKRLNMARTKGFAPWPGDLRYHIVQAGCSICKDRLEGGEF